MNKKSVIIETSLKSDEIEQILKDLIIKKANIFSAICKTRYQGEIITNKFKLITYSAPPAEVSGSFENEKIEMLTKWDSMSGSLKAFLFTFGYTLIGVFLMLGIINYPSSSFVYIGVVLAVFSLHIFVKVYMFWNYSEPNPDIIITLLSKKVNGHIRVNQ